MKKYLAGMVVILAIAGATAVFGGPEKKGADYGGVVINNFSQKAGMAPVVFDHWIHRSQYTCRLCHIDIGFAMKAGGSEIKAADNMKGVYCGVCHNGKMQYAGKPIFMACTADKSDTKRCDKCHSQGKAMKKDMDFAGLTAKLPKDHSGNGVDWEKAAENGTIKLTDFIDGVSLKRPAKPIEKDFAIKPKAEGVGDIIFSHKKHAMWNGCEVCHPEIFKGGKKGTTKYTMDDINQGKFCGLCHLAVAFPVEECDRCHTKSFK